MATELVAENNRNFFSQVPEAGSLPSRCWQGWLFLEAPRESFVPCPSGWWLPAVLGCLGL